MCYDFLTRSEQVKQRLSQPVLWEGLRQGYEDECRQKGFADPARKHGWWEDVHGGARNQSEASFYCRLCTRFAQERQGGALTFETYNAMLYWKHYSGQLGKPNEDQQRRSTDTLRFVGPRVLRFLGGGDIGIDALVNTVAHLLQDGERLYGMGDRDAIRIPTRTTFLHFLSPGSIPIFDTMVIRAVTGLRERLDDPMVRSMSQCLACYRSYVSLARELSGWLAHELEQGRIQFGAEVGETPLRVLDMALWVDGHQH